MTFEKNVNTSNYVFLFVIVTCSFAFRWSTFNSNNVLIISVRLDIPRYRYKDIYCRESLLTGEGRRTLFYN
jgi:hypothetical protein